MARKSPTTITDVMKEMLAADPEVRAKLERARAAGNPYAAEILKRIGAAWPEPQPSIGSSSPSPSQ
jgi:hypothetical protein